MIGRRFLTTKQLSYQQLYCQLTEQLCCQNTEKYQNQRITTERGILRVLCPEICGRQPLPGIAAVPNEPD